MTEYLKKTFTVPRGSADPKTCSHGDGIPWTDKRGRCVMCGERVEPRTTEIEREDRKPLRE